MPRKTEKEKMLAGQLYNCLAPELAQIRQDTQSLMRQYNGTSGADDRRAILKKLLGKVGRNSMIEPPFYCSYGQNIYLGDHVYLNFGCTILDNNQVRIGDHVMVGPSVQFYTAAHPLEAAIRIKGFETAKKIIIEENVWIGGGAIILPGITVGTNAVIGAGAVVTREVPPNTVVAGNPARIIRELPA